MVEEKIVQVENMESQIGTKSSEDSVEINVHEGTGMSEEKENHLESEPQSENLEKVNDELKDQDQMDDGNFERIDVDVQGDQEVEDTEVVQGDKKDGLEFQVHEVDGEEVETEVVPGDEDDDLDERNVEESQEVEGEGVRNSEDDESNDFVVQDVENVENYGMEDQIDEMDERNGEDVEEPEAVQSDEDDALDDQGNNDVDVNDEDDNDEDDNDEDDNDDLEEQTQTVQHDQDQTEIDYEKVDVPEQQNENSEQNILSPQKKKATNSKTKKKSRRKKSRAPTRPRPNLSRLPKWRLVQRNEIVNKRKRKEELMSKYRTESMRLSLFTGAIESLDEINQKRMDLQEKFTAKIPEEKRYRPTGSYVEPPPIEQPGPMEQTPSALEKRYQYHDAVVKHINDEPRYKNFYRNRLTEERQRKLQEARANLARKQSLLLKADKLRQDIEDILLQFQEISDRRVSRRKKRVQSTSKSARKRKKLLPNLTAEKLEKKRREKRLKEMELKKKQVLQKISYPKLVLKKTLTDYQLLERQKAALLRKTRSQQSIPDYLSMLREQRSQKVKKRKKSKSDDEIVIPVAEISREKSLSTLSEADEPETPQTYPTSTKRQFILHEILTTERTYVNSMIEFFEDYARPIKEEKLLSPDLIQIVFDEFEFIKNLHVQILSQLEDFHEANYLPPLEPGGLKQDLGQSIGEIFLNLARHFKQYTNYINQYERIFELVTATGRKNREFQLFRTQMVDKKREENSRLTDLPDYLILPIQRIPRYILLFQDLVKNTVPEHPDYDKIKTAHSLLQDVADYCNIQKKKKENYERFVQLTKSIKQIKDLFHENRVFIREGHLTFSIKKKKKDVIKECSMYLFNDVCVVKYKKSARKFYLFEDVERVFDVLPLEDDAAGYAFELVLNQTDSHQFSCVSKHDREEWLRHFELCKPLIAVEEERLKEEEEADSKFEKYLSSAESIATPLSDIEGGDLEEEIEEAV